jgi:O-6-methylguanine DNA methyltransferase
MALFVLGYHLGIPGPMQELSRERPDVEWRTRPIGRRWFAEADGVERARSDRRPGSRALLVRRSASERRFFEELDRWDAVVLPPLLWRAGELTMRVLSSRSGPPSAWRRRHRDARLIAKRTVHPAELPGEIGATPPWTLGLSGRQRQVLALAVQEGYYDVPRRTNVAKLAGSLGLGRSTTEEHLRAAESSVIRAAAPLTRPWGTQGGPHAGAEAWAPFARFSAELELYVWMALRGERIARVELRGGVPPGGAAGSHPYLDRIVEHITTGRDDMLDLPVDLELTPFDRQVLEEVRRVPSGQTASYGEIARRVGRPGAARAVGNAVARNPALLVVPCHRVVPSSGRIGNYSGGGGARTKARLLRQERALPEADP